MTTDIHNNATSLLFVKQNWNSFGTPLTEPYNYISSRSYRFGWRIREAVSNTLFGYTMVSRKNATLITKTVINAVSYKILETVSESDNFCPDCTYDDDVLSVPVQFSIGNGSVVNSKLPPSVKPLPTGFVQFRAYGRTGSVYAMCPAVKVDDWRGEFVCIGGMKNPDSPYLDDCNDFTNWNGLPNTAVQKVTPVDYAHSQRDLDSTIMIFYR
uniref:Uncharacterized protein LOC108950076 n=1 Tax=Phallusia mammillata TaxID=59560 RepID=A0A6F9DJY8_9ASCI|nr:uncharacterized protein LOC108950076 [Phallusia mammillata]